MWGQSEKVDVCRSGREASPEPGRAGTLILNFQHPELWENKLLLSKPRSLFCCGNPSRLRHSWTLPSDGSILKFFTPISLGSIFLSTSPPHPHTPRKLRTEPRILHCLWHWLLLLSCSSLKRSSLSKQERRSDKNWITLIIYSFSRYTYILASGIQEASYWLPSSSCGYFPLRLWFLLAGCSNEDQVTGWQKKLG